MRRLWVVSYDISDDEARRKVSEELESFGKRVQYSVFECWLDAESLSELRSLIEPLVDPASDSIRYYPLCSRCRGDIVVFGRGDVPEDDDVTVV